MADEDLQSRDGGDNTPRVVLIVDDEAATRKLLRSTIERLPLSCQIFEAVDGDAALQIARRERLDLALIDIVLPGSTVSGVLVCQELCKSLETKVVIVSGLATDAIIRSCISLGALDYIRKPFTIDDIRGKLERWLTE